MALRTKYPWEFFTHPWIFLLRGLSYTLIFVSCLLLTCSWKSTLAQINNYIYIYVERPFNDARKQNKFMAVKFSPLEMTGEITENLPLLNLLLYSYDRIVYSCTIFLSVKWRGDFFKFVNLFLRGYPIIWFTFISIEGVQLVGITWFQVQFQINSTWMPVNCMRQNQAQLCHSQSVCMRKHAILFAVYYEHVISYLSHHDTLWFSELSRI